MAFLLFFGIFLIFSVVRLDFYCEVIGSYKAIKGHAFISGTAFSHSPV
jgi:hypothetical protein